MSLNFFIYTMIMVSFRGERNFFPLPGLGLCTQGEQDFTTTLIFHQGTYWGKTHDFYIHPFYEFFHKASRMADMTGLILVVTVLFPVKMEYQGLDLPTHLNHNKIQTTVSRHWTTDSVRQ